MLSAARKKPDFEVLKIPSKFVSKQFSRYGKQLMLELIRGKAFTYPEFNNALSQESIRAHDYSGRSFNEKLKLFIEHPLIAPTYVRRRLAGATYIFHNEKNDLILVKELRKGAIEKIWREKAAERIQK